ncbi:MAG: hypothetical protein AB4372_15710 [Xenococcus sp. (in: cyanobacteria)]
MRPQKSIILSMTFWGALGLFVETLQPITLDAINNGFSVTWGFEVATALITFMITLIGRFNASTTLFTPKRCLGPNKKKYSELVNQGGVK